MLLVRHCDDSAEESLPLSVPSDGSSGSGLLLTPTSFESRLRTLLGDDKKYGEVASSRVLLLNAQLPLGSFLRLSGAVHCLLEPFPFPASITTLDAFVAGTPVVAHGGSLRTRGMAQLSAMLYRRMWAGDTNDSSSGSYSTDGRWTPGECCVAGDEDSFVEMAVAIAHNRNGLRDRTLTMLKDRSHLLFQDSAARKEWEGFLEKAVRAVSLGQEKMEKQYGNLSSATRVKGTSVPLPTPASSKREEAPRDGTPLSELSVALVNSNTDSFTAAAAARLLAARVRRALECDDRGKALWVGEGARNEWDLACAAATDLDAVGGGGAPLYQSVSLLEAEATVAANAVGQTASSSASSTSKAAPLALALGSTALALALQEVAGTLTLILQQSPTTITTSSGVGAGEDLTAWAHALPHGINSPSERRWPPDVGGVLNIASDSSGSQGWATAAALAAAAARSAVSLDGRLINAAACGTFPLIALGLWDAAADLWAHAARLKRPFFWGALVPQSARSNAAVSVLHPWAALKAAEASVPTEAAEGRHEGWDWDWGRAASADPDGAAIREGSSVVHPSTVLDSGEGGAQDGQQRRAAFSRLQFGGYNSAYVRHLAAQLRHLASRRGSLPAAFLEVANELDAVGDEMDGARGGAAYFDPEADGAELLPPDRAHVEVRPPEAWFAGSPEEEVAAAAAAAPPPALARTLAVLGRSVFLRPTPSLPEGALASPLVLNRTLPEPGSGPRGAATPQLVLPRPGPTAAVAEAEFRARGVAVVDGLLSATALAELRRFCEESTFYHKAYIQVRRVHLLPQGLHPGKESPPSTTRPTSSWAVGRALQRSARGPRPDLLPLTLGIRGGLHGRRLRRVGPFAPGNWSGAASMRPVLLVASPRQYRSFGLILNIINILTPFFITPKLRWPRSSSAPSRPSSGRGASCRRGPTSTTRATSAASTPTPTRAPCR